MIQAPPRGQDVEWGYAFDVHLNAFFPLLMILHLFQLAFLSCEYSFYILLIKLLVRFVKVILALLEQKDLVNFVLIEICLLLVMNLPV